MWVPRTHVLRHIHHEIILICAVKLGIIRGTHRQKVGPQPATHVFCDVSGDLVDGETEQKISHGTI